MNLRVLEDDRIVMELPDGAEHVIRNSELIPAYYCLPKEFLDFLKKYGKRLPRKPSQLFLQPEDLKFVESNLFRNVIHEAFARLAWSALGMKGWIGFYSRYAPQWIVAHQTDRWIPLAKELSFMKTNAELFAPPECESRQPIPSRFDAQEIVEGAIYYEFLGSDLDMILETCRSMPCEEDFSLETKNHNHRLRTFWREWYHWRTKHPDVYYGVIVENTNFSHHDKLMSLAAEDDTEGEVVADLHGKAFYNTLSSMNQEIISLRGRGVTMEQIAKQMGFATHSAVQKRIQRIGRAYELWSGEDLGFKKKQEKKPYFDYDAIRRQKHVI